jgi:hypothetical protein
MQMGKKLRFGKSGIARFVDDGGGRAERRERRHQLQQSRIEAGAGRDAPARILALPHAGHLFRVFGRNEPGENRPL